VCARVCRALASIQFANTAPRHVSFTPTLTHRSPLAWPFTCPNNPDLTMNYASHRSQPPLGPRVFCLAASQSHGRKYLLSELACISYHLCTPSQATFPHPRNRRYYWLPRPDLSSACLVDILTVRGLFQSTY
jgi:hypothetical protein